MQKLQRRSTYATVDRGTKISRLYISDKISGNIFLIDSGADISVIPPNHKEKSYPPCNFNLFAANGTPIKTYGSKTVVLNLGLLNLGLRRPIRWLFIIADVQLPIIGSDLLKKHDLLINMKNCKLTDKSTTLSVKGISLR